MLRGEERQWRGAGGCGWGSGEGRWVPLGQEAIGDLILAPLVILQFNAFHSNLQRSSATRHDIVTRRERNREVAYKEDRAASGRDGRRCHVRVQGTENLIRGFLESDGMGPLDCGVGEVVQIEDVHISSC